MRDAIVVRGGWDGHAPVEATERFIPFLRANGFAVEVHHSLEVYADADRMGAADLVLQSWSVGKLSDAEAAGLDAAVRTGTGLAGWHGGIVGAFHNERYQHLTGGVFVHHPAGFVDHTLTVVPTRADHPIVTGIGPVRLHTEKYWVLSDPLNDVLAEVVFDADVTAPWQGRISMPAVWTRRWGAGRVFVSTVGHKVDDLDLPDVRAITERGLLWAARER
ncbi:ThuA domain-containing protein [Micromonospora sp. NPDC049679]|uniref:ThuA domain-containing protein n=1 Tax=Micromonospora sp. NPDC049679 TaxID=3155920 RepID=UPI0034064B9E